MVSRITRLEYAPKLYWHIKSCTKKPSHCDVDYLRQETMEKLNQLISILKDLEFIIWDHLLSEDHILIIKTYEISAYQIHLEFDSEYTKFTVSIWTRTEGNMFDGDRSDITMLLALIAVIFLRFSFNLKISLLIQPHPAADNEIYSILIFIKESKYIERKFDSESIQDIVDIALSIKMLEHLLAKHFNFGKGSNLLAPLDKRWFENIIKEMNLNENLINYSSRTNDTFNWLYAPEDGIIHFYFSNKLSFYHKIKKKYSSKSITGIDCLLLKTDGFDSDTVAVELEAVSLSELVAHCSDDNTQKLYIPIDNFFIALGEKSITAIACDCSSRVLAKEIRRIKHRQATENEFLFDERGFKWCTKIDDEEFEKMILELLYYEPGFWGIQKVGATREGDGNRDLQAIVSWAEKEKIRTEKVIIQCKAYQKSVGKSDVKDIRDTIENYNAEGFMIVTSSRITVQLQDHLEKLRDQKNFYIEWWNRENIEIRLRQHPEILMRYPKIITPFDLKSIE
ncbi:MAG: restriction endonuclease [Ignavibacteriales bacterium]